LDKTALSVFELASQADQGSLIAQYPLPVQRSETSASLFRRLEELHFRAGFDLAGSLGSGVIHSEEQDERKAAVWPKRRPRDGEIKATMSRVEVDRLVRALLGPYPRAFVQGPNGTHAVEQVSSTALEGAVEVECADGPLWLIGKTK
jgi:methionyl-tRNA formyltransferase